MPKNDFKQALKAVTDICKFEAWLRFYFVQDNNGTLTIEFTEETLKHIKDKYPPLAGLAEEYNHEIISPEKSQSAVVTYINETIDGSSFTPGYVATVLNSKSFSVEMNAFNIWLSAHENQLDASVFDFDEWMQLFEAWKRTEQGQNTLTGLSRSNESPSAKTH